MTASRRGLHRTQTELEIVKETETTAVIDGQHGMGHVIAYRAMRLAMDKARQYGLGAVAVRNGTHYGIAGYYPLMAAEEGMMGLCRHQRPAGHRAHLWRRADAGHQPHRLCRALGHGLSLLL